MYNLKKVNVRNERGFTLVEILVVITIIATLSSLSIPVGMKLINSGLATQSKAQMKEVGASFKLFEEDHGSISYSMTYNGSGKTWNGAAWTCREDTPRNGTWGRAVNNHYRFYVAASGKAGGVNIFSRSNKDYFTTLDAKDMDNNNVRGGLTRFLDNNVVNGLVDPWGRRYYGHFDMDGDGEIFTNSGSLGDRHAKTATLGSDVYFLFSRGPDGIWDTGDDILSHELR